MAMAGICLISGSSGAALSLNPLGDILAIGAAIIWAVYSLLTRKSGISATMWCRRPEGPFLRAYFYDPCSFPSWISTWRPHSFIQLSNLGNLLFLGLGASALCFVTWNYAVRALGSVKTSVYIYMVPVITAVTSALILGEKITAASAVGILLTLGGLFLSQKWGKKRLRMPRRRPYSRKGSSRLWNKTEKKEMRTETMEAENRKCVMILDEELPAGVLANAAGILGMTLGKTNPGGNRSGRAG